MHRVKTVLGIFGYASLVSRESVSETLGRDVGKVQAVELTGYLRRWSVARDNRSFEKTFARMSDDWVPEYLLMLNIEKSDQGGRVNGALFGVSEVELELMKAREKRYRAVDVTDSVKPHMELQHRGRGAPPVPYEKIFAFQGGQLHTVKSPPANSCVLAAYIDAVTAGFESLGERELQLFRSTTADPGVQVIDAVLVKDEVSAGNPKAW